MFFHRFLFLFVYLFFYKVYTINVCLSVYFQINGEWGTEIVEYFAFLFSIKNETMMFK